MAEWVNIEFDPGGAGTGPSNVTGSGSGCCCPESGSGCNAALSLCICSTDVIFYTPPFAAVLCDVPGIHCHDIDYVPPPPGTVTISLGDYTCVIGGSDYTLTLDEIELTCTGFEPNIYTLGLGGHLTWPGGVVPVSIASLFGAVDSDFFGTHIFRVSVPFPPIDLQITFEISEAPCV